jgi:hypothetical protein
MAANRSTISVEATNNRDTNLKDPTMATSPLPERLRVALFDQRRMEKEINYLPTELNAEQSTGQTSKWPKGFAASLPVAAALKLNGQPVEEHFDLWKTRQCELGMHDHAEIIKTSAGQYFAWLRHGGFREIAADLYEALKETGGAEFAQ